ncbi:MAG: J domain-containing protein [Acidimicrobiales bacterium]
MTHYEVLGVPPDASVAEIRRAYLRLARRYHPDMSATAGAAAQAEAERRMRAINQAWAVLGDRSRREVYDRRGATGGDSGFRPHDPTDDGFDPRQVADRPYRATSPGRAARGSLASVLPATLLAVAVGALSLGLVMGSFPLIAVSLVVAVASCLAVVVVLLVAMSRATRDEG